MNEPTLHMLARLGSSTPLVLAAYVVLVAVMANVNALVDAVVHPDIPYFDREHLIVGGVTAIASAVLFGVLLAHVRHLGQALGRIRTLERILPVCAHCKRVHRADADPNDPASWKPIETHIMEATDTLLSHGICPDCQAQYYPGLTRPRR